MKSIICFLLLLVSLPNYAQRQRNYVYIFDCTSSMQRGNQPIWGPAKKFMKEDLAQLDDNATVTIVLFHQNTTNPIRFRAKDYNWSDIDSRCEQMVKNSTRTGICGAWDKGLQFIDKNRNNYFYLFTDGKENVIHPNGTQKVCDRIRQWCKRTHSNDYAFFVSLPSVELMNSPEIQMIKKATESCDRTYFISGKIGPFGSFDRSNFNMNSHSIKDIKVGFSDCGSFPAKVICDSPYYEISLKDGQINKGKATFSIKEKSKPSKNCQIHFKVVCDKKDMNICNPDMFINIDTRKLANLDLAQPSGDDGEYDAGEAETYSKFLFFEGKEKVTLTLDLGAAFNNQARKKNANMNMALSIPTNIRNCSIRYNGRPVGNTFTMNASDAKSILQIDVPHALATGDFYIGIRGKSNTLESVNSNPGKTYRSKIYFEHDTCMHPAEVVLIWIGIIIAILLVLWFCFLKWLIYPRIRLAYLQMTCDSEHYYVNKKINGARRVIISNKRGKQSWINKLFTGRIVYVTDQMWTSQWEITPKGRNKSARIHLSGSYFISPLCSEVRQYEEYTLTNTETKTITKINL